MEAVILAAGLGTRMRPFSYSESKVMISFLGKPLLAYHVEESIKNGIRKFVIVCNKDNVNIIRKYFGSDYLGRNFDYVIQDKLLGPAHAVYLAGHLLKDEFFIVKYGDSFSEEDQMKRLLEKYSENKAVDGIAILKKVKNPEEFGIAKFDKERRLIEIVEKPKHNSPSYYANVGISLLKRKTFFHALDKIGFENVMPLAEYLLRCKWNVSYWISKSEHIDIGRPWNILEATKVFIDKFGGRIDSFYISKNARISQKSYIGKDAIIEEDVEIGDYSHVNCYIGKGTRIDRSYIMEDSKVGKDCNIKGSVIGRSNIICDNFTTINDEEFGLFSGEGVIISENIKSYSKRVVFPYKVVQEDIKKNLTVRAILFDVDNTLLKTKEVAKEADMAAMSLFAKYTNFSSDELYQKWENIVDSLKQTKEPQKRTREYSYSQLASLIGIDKTKDACNAFVHTLINSIKPVKNVNEVLSYLKKYRLAAFTEDSQEISVAKLKSAGLFGFFEFITTSDDISVMKPDERYYKVIFERLDISPQECVVVGDDYEKDLETAKDLGCLTVCFGQDSRADYQIKDFYELIEILNKN